jgi:hypothetical protein
MIGLGEYVGKLSPEYDVMTFLIIPPLKNSAPSELNDIMTRVKPASVPQNCLTTSRAAAVQRV